MLCSSSCSSPILRASSFFTCCSDWMALVSSMFSLVCTNEGILVYISHHLKEYLTIHYRDINQPLVQWLNKDMKMIHANLFNHKMYLKEISSTYIKELSKFLTTLTKPFCSSASWSFSVRFWVSARLIVALSDWTSSNMRRRSSSSWTWCSTWRSSSSRRVSCSVHRRLSCSLSRSWGKEIFRRPITKASKRNSKFFHTAFWRCLFRASASTEAGKRYRSGLGCQFRSASDLTPKVVSETHQRACVNGQASWPDQGWGDMMMHKNNNHFTWHQAAPLFALYRNSNHTQVPICMERKTSDDTQAPISIRS